MTHRYTIAKIRQYTYTAVENILNCYLGCTSSYIDYEFFFVMRLSLWFMCRLSGGRDVGDGAFSCKSKTNYPRPRVGAGDVSDDTVRHTRLTTRRVRVTLSLFHVPRRAAHTPSHIVHDRRSVRYMCVPRSLSCVYYTECTHATPRTHTQPTRLVTASQPYSTHNIPSPVTHKTVRRVASGV